MKATRLAVIAGPALALLFGASGGCARSADSTSEKNTGDSASNARSVATSYGAIDEDSAEVVDQSAIAALQRMSTYLRTLKSFQVSATTTRETVLQNGQKVQFGNTIQLIAQRPNKFRAEATSDRQQRMFFYDGATFTLWAPRMNYYAAVPATGTIAQVVNKLADRYSLETPLLDLFEWGTTGADSAKITSAVALGDAEVDGTTCEQYAFRQPGLDWQVWIQRGDYPLPRKVVLTTLTDDARPQYSAVYTWNLAPSFNDAAFSFVAPPTAHRIEIAPTDSSVDIAKR